MFGWFGAGGSDFVLERTLVREVGIVKMDRRRGRRMGTRTQEVY